MKDVSKLFNKFAGKRIAYPARMIDPTEEDIRDLAAANGYTVRFLYPGMPVTEDYCATRVNVEVTNVKGTLIHHIGKKFTLG
jgi:hypothetical protein